jgi:hypothetical protein
MGRQEIKECQSCFEESGNTFDQKEIPNDSSDLDIDIVIAKQANEPLQDE